MLRTSKQCRIPHGRYMSFFGKTYFLAKLPN